MLGVVLFIRDGVINNVCIDVNLTEIVYNLIC